MPGAPLALETERLHLRQFRNEDFATYEMWCADMNIMRYLGGRTFTRNEAWRSLAYMLGHWTLRGYGYYALEERSTGRFIGRAGYTDAEGWPGFELGWTLAPEAQGKGYATEAARLLLDQAFEVLGQPSVMSLIHPDNTPSQKVSARLGQTVIGETEVVSMPVRIHSIDRATWAARRQAGSR